MCLQNESNDKNQRNGRLQLDFRWHPKPLQAYNFQKKLDRNGDWIGSYKAKFRTHLFVVECKLPNNKLAQNIHKSLGQCIECLVPHKLHEKITTSKQT
jgi:hypothetical protein